MTAKPTRPRRGGSRFGDAEQLAVGAVRRPPVDPPSPERLDGLADGTSAVNARMKGGLERGRER
jgi:hypothetical protein